MQMQVHNELVQGGTDVGCQAGKLPDQPEHIEAGPLPEQVPEVGAVAALCAEREQSADGDERDAMLRIVEQADVHASLFDDRRGVQTKLGEQAWHGQDRRHAQRTFPHQWWITRWVGKQGRLFLHDALVGSSRSQ